MPRLRNKADLIVAGNTNFQKLLAMTDSRSQIEKDRSYNFGGETNAIK